MSDPPPSQPTGNEPALPGNIALTGEEPFIGGARSLAQLLAIFDQDDQVLDREVMIARMATVLPELCILAESGGRRERRIATQMIGMLVITHPESHPQTIPLLGRLLIERRAHLNNFHTTRQIITWLGQSGSGEAAVIVVREMLHLRRYYQRDRAGLSPLFKDHLQEALLELGAAAIPALVALELDEFISNEALPFCMSMICRSDPEVRPAVQRWLETHIDSEELWDRAYSSIGRILEAVTTDDLVKRALSVAARTRSSEIRHHVYKGLSYVSHPLIAETAWTLLHSRKSYLYPVAGEMLIFSRREEDIRRIIELTEHTDFRLRQRALLILRNRKNREEIAVYIRCLRDSHFEVRREALYALEDVPAEEAIPVLIECLNEKDYQQRSEVHHVLWTYQQRFPHRLDEIRRAVRKFTSTFR